MAGKRSQIPPIASDWPHDVELWRDGRLAGWVHTLSQQDASQFASFWESLGGKADIFKNDRRSRSKTENADDDE